MTQQTTLTDELTGSNVIQTDHDGFTFTDLAVLLLDAVLFIYTAWRSYHFLSASVPDDMAIMAMIGLWGLDIGMIIWSLVWIFGSTEKYQDWTAMTFFLIDLAGVVLTSLTDSLLFSNPDGSMTEMLQGIAGPAIPLIVVANVVAGFIYHMTSPNTRARREARRAEAEYRRKMENINKEKRDLVYAEGLIMAKQETLDKATLLAEIKVAQDALEQATRNKLRDQVGVHEAAKGKTVSENQEAKPNELDGLSQKLMGLKETLKSFGGGNPPPTPSHQLEEDNLLIDPQSLNYTPFIARLACQFNEHNVLPGESLEAAQIQGGDYVIRVAGTEDPFARVTLYDLARLMSGQSEDLNISGIGKNQPVQISASSNGNGNTMHPHSGNEGSPT